jgi:antitoxin (DNA-binding transcriptional repressor) of toxin-antitoxin stability system
LYIVHMKRMTASEARKNWFRLLDEVAAGAVVCIERGGRRIVLRREPDATAAGESPDYSSLLQVPGVEDADRWGWRWPGAGGDIEMIAEGDETDS